MLIRAINDSFTNFHELMKRFGQGNFSDMSGPFSFAR
jgi:hypothetical protein